MAPALPTFAPDPSLISDTINENDRGASVTLAAALGLGFSLFFLLFRLFTRWPVRKLFKVDDAAITVATVLAVGQVVAITVAVHFGFGERQSRLKASELRAMFKATFASDILFITSLALAKLAIVFLVHRLTNDSNHRKAAHTCTGIIAFWTVLSIILVSIPCHGQLSWVDLDASCSLAASKWTVIVAFEIIAETSLLALPLYLLWKIQIKRLTRMFALSLFWVRICVPALSLWRLKQVQHLQSADDYTFKSVDPAILTQVQMHISLIFATIPSISPFLRAFNTGFLVPDAGHVENSRKCLSINGQFCGSDGEAGTDLSNMKSRGSVLTSKSHLVGAKSSSMSTTPTSPTTTLTSATTSSPRLSKLPFLNRSKSPLGFENDKNCCNTKLGTDREPTPGQRDDNLLHLGPLRPDQFEHETIIESVRLHRRRDAESSMRLGTPGRSRNSSSSRCRNAGGSRTQDNAKHSSACYADCEDADKEEDDEFLDENMLPVRLESDRIFVRRTVDVNYENADDTARFAKG